MLSHRALWTPTCTTAAVSSGLTLSGPSVGGLPDRGGVNSSARFGDDLLVRRAARDVAWRAAALIAVTIVLVTGLGTAVVVQFQARAADTLLRSTVATADDVGDPPPGSWLVLARGAQVLSSPGLPPSLAPGLARLRRHPARSPVLAEVFDRGRGREYRVATQERTGQVVQVVFDLTLDRQQRGRLLETMGAASAVGLLCAVGLGTLLGRRAVRPLAQALGLQRAFIADASHELRTPLTLLSTRAQVLELNLQSSAGQGEVPWASVLADARGVVQTWAAWVRWWKTCCSRPTRAGSSRTKLSTWGDWSRKWWQAPPRMLSPLACGWWPLTARGRCRVWCWARPRRCAGRCSPWSTTPSTTAQGAVRYAWRPAGNGAR